jgi:hypothetical protein
MKLHHLSCHNKLLSNPFPLMFISRYFIPGILMGSASAELDWTRAGIVRSPVRFLAALVCSVLRLC